MKALSSIVLAFVLIGAKAEADVTRAGPAATPCPTLSGLTYDDPLARQSVMWAAGYWTAFNIVLADSCMMQRDLSGLNIEVPGTWEKLQRFCARFDHHDL